MGLAEEEKRKTHKTMGKTKIIKKRKAKAGEALFFF